MLWTLRDKMPAQMGKNKQGRFFFSKLRSFNDLQFRSDCRLRMRRLRKTVHMRQIENHSFTGRRIVHKVEDPCSIHIHHERAVMRQEVAAIYR